MLALTSCVCVMLICVLIWYTKRREKDNLDNDPSPEQPIDDGRNGMAQLQEMSLRMRRNHPKRAAFGMRDIDPPTRREGASQIELADVVVDTPCDAGEGETTKETS